MKPTPSTRVRCTELVGDPLEQIPYERATRLAVEEGEIRVKWWSDAYDFWTARLCATGDEEAAKMRGRIYDAWSAATNALNELKRPGVVVGGSWLARATFEQLEAKSPTARSQRPAATKPQ